MIQFKSGDALYELMKYEESIKVYEKIIHNFKNIKGKEIANVYGHLGKSQLKLKKYREAKHSFEKAIELNSHHSGAYNNLGMLLKEQGDAEKDEDKKKKLYEDAHEKFKHSLDIIKKELDNKQPSKTLRSLKIFEKYAIVNNNLGIILSNLKEYRDSRKFFEEAIAIKPNFVDAYVNLGVLFTEEGNYDEAIKNFETAIELDPSNYKAYFNLISSKSKIKIQDIDWLQTINWKRITAYIFIPGLCVLIFITLYSLIISIFFGSQEIIETNTTIGLLSNITTTKTIKNTVNFSQELLFIGMIILLIILPSLLTRIKTLKLSTSGIELEMETPKEVDSDTFLSE
jgi:tetratricopeptide (TPR) repeat protein